MKMSTQCEAIVEKQQPANSVLRVIWKGTENKMASILMVLYGSIVVLLSECCVQFIMIGRC